MANRIVATFSPEDVRAMGLRFQGLREALTPLMNTLAGEIVFWSQNSDGAWLVVASSKRPTASDDFRTYYVERHGVWPAKIGEHHHEYIARLCETFADYVNERMGAS